MDKAQNSSWLKNHKKLLLIASSVVLVLVAGFVIIKASTSKPSPSTTTTSSNTTATSSPRASKSKLPPCETDTGTNCDKGNVTGKHITACTGKGPATITASPIAFNDLAYIQPMGLEIGGHVTPIDHGYFYIKGAFTKPPTIAPVYSPIDGIITGVGSTSRKSADGKGTFYDNTIAIEATCTFRVRFSNLVKFGGPLADKIGELKPDEGRTPNYTVKAGELIGYTGQPTANGIDVWVENDDTTLTGFINPAQYVSSEAWKLHMVDLFDYTNEPLKSQMLALTERDASPRWGKIDYDVDGKLIGTWFKQGTGGYGGNQKGTEGYWSGHLSIVPNGNDPTQAIISFGDYQGQAEQFAIVGNKPDPATVDQSTGLVKYELGKIETYSADTGKTWDGMAYAPHVRARASKTVEGTVLMQLTDKRALKMEIFPGKTAAQVTDFTSAALTYER